MKHILIIIMFLISSILLGCGLPAAQNNQNGTEQSGESADIPAYFLPAPTVGMDSLNSYALDLTISFSGMRDGVSYESTDTYHQDLNQEKNAQFTYSTITQSEGSLEQIVAGNLGEAYYSKSGDGQCKVSWGVRAEGYEPFNPTNLLPPVLAVLESDPQVINGIQTNHYILDEKSLGYPSTTKVEGQIWLSVNGGYIMKYLLILQDESGFFGDGVKGEQEFDYELSQVNAFQGPDLPEGCLAVLTDFPITEDAYDIQRLPDALGYSSPSDMTQIRSFYEQQLTNLGWVLSSSAELSSDAFTLVFLNPEESKTAFITLQLEGEPTWVTVKVEAAEDLSASILP